MKKIALIVMAVFILAAGMMLAGTGGKRMDVLLTGYTVSEDGGAMTLRAGVAGSMGYIRTLKAREDGDKIYLTFYSTFGLNSTIGAKNEFKIKLGPSSDRIYVYGATGEYKPILQKNSATNGWEKVG